MHYAYGYNNNVCIIYIPFLAFCQVSHVWSLVILLHQYIAMSSRCLRGLSAFRPQITRRLPQAGSPIPVAGN